MISGEGARFEYYGGHLKAWLPESVFVECDLQNVDEDAVRQVFAKVVCPASEQYRARIAKMRKIQEEVSITAMHMAARITAVIEMISAAIMEAVSMMRREAQRAEGGEKP
jgi:hypothetical protein